MRHTVQHAQLLLVRHLATPPAARAPRPTTEVRDRGHGIAPDDVARLKQPFTRASEARSREDGAAGAGLGLAIVERIARLHGGHFDLLPREGGGLVARVTLAATSAKGVRADVG